MAIGPVSVYSWSFKFQLQKLPGRSKCRLSGESIFPPNATYTPFFCSTAVFIASRRLSAASEDSDGREEDAVSTTGTPASEKSQKSRAAVYERV